jgi:hypothetical protein
MRCHVSYIFGSHLLTKVGSDATICHAAPLLAEVSSDAAMCPVAPDLTYLLR